MLGSPILTLHDPATSQHHYASGLWQQQTFYSILQRNAERVPDKPALRDGARRLTWSELLQTVDAIAASLADAGLRRGSRVSVFLPSRVEVCMVYLACSRNGYVCNASLHQNYTVAGVVELLQRINTAALFAQPGYGADAGRADIFAAAQDVRSVRRIYQVAPHGDASSLRTPAGRVVVPFPYGEDKVVCSEPIDPNPDKIVCLAFTSGTTGIPKGVLHSDNTLLANARTLLEDWKHPRDTILLCLSPMSHAIGTIALTQTLLGGFELVLSTAPQGCGALDWILETGATYVMGVPTHALDVLAEARRRDLRKLGDVRVFYMGGSAISRQVAEDLLGRGIKPQNVYGMTENGATQYTHPDDDVNTVIHTCGRGCRGYEVRIWNADDPDVEAGPGEVGEIGGRGACLMLGYYSDQAATEESFNRNGFFMSGDLAKLDERGNLQVMGRKKDLIIRGGRNIYPITIENLALRHADVFKAAAFPVDDERLGEKVCLALIAKRNDVVIEAMQLLTFLDAQGLSKYDMPEYFIQVREFPMTPSGKILKRELIEWARSGRIKPAPVRWVGGSATRS